MDVDETPKPLRLNLTNKPHALYKKPHALYKKPHALYSLRPSGFGRQGCGFNPIPTPFERVEPQSRDGQGLRFHTKCTLFELIWSVGLNQIRPSGRITSLRHADPCNQKLIKI